MITNNSAPLIVHACRRVGRGTFLHQRWQRHDGRYKRGHVRPMFTTVRVAPWLAQLSQLDAEMGYFRG